MSVIYITKLHYKRSLQKFNKSILIIIEYLN